ncbi:hypothetical protein BBK36DRAFT_1144367 [Trichoderma citrinoviride]|uniref:Uncharacterized protein n=1 Tax=Trichoderma citrinoviride TaxID=58853 RepID=A0A2T4B0I1_9HYPO|nr:hypothetical protein BBK36DRAFT_1144367 [Trichoderma citrinoviride]PTB62826.1 hypothetical protein BBK36DRAFT_1144367 [Trichoderma citrinoviride]
MDTSTIFDSLRLIGRYIALLGRLLTLPLRLLIWNPLSYLLSYLLSALRIVFFPVFYLIAYVAGWLRGVVDLITALQPIYTFLATAALVGALAGLALATSSTVITSYLGMQGDIITRSNVNGKEARSRNPQDKDYLSSSNNTLVKDDSSSNEGEWYWPTDPSPSRRRPATGLLSQTILEEEDDSDA